MITQVHPAETMLRGDSGYNARNLRVTSLPRERELLTGVFRDDGRLPGQPRRPDRPFHLEIHGGFHDRQTSVYDWQHLNSRIFYSLQNGVGEVRMLVL